MKIMSVRNTGIMVKNIAVTFFLFAFMALGGCNKSDDTSCQSTAQAVSAAAAKYVSAQSVANCQLYRAAIIQYLSSTCGVSLSATDKQSFQNILNNLPC
jgi:hypothetical protein